MFKSTANPITVGGCQTPTTQHLLPCGATASMPLIRCSSSSDEGHVANTPCGSSSSSSVSSKSSLRQMQSDSSGQNPPSSESSGSGSESLDCRQQSRFAAFLELEHRRARTRKARAAAIASKASRRLAKHLVLEAPQHPAESFRNHIKGSNSLWGPGSNTRIRVRVLVSYLKAWGGKLVKFVTERSPEESSPSHCLTTSIIDDCNMRLSTVTPGVHQWVLSRVTAVMNNVQVLIFGFQRSSEDAGPVLDYRAFPVYTPLVCFPRADCATICQEFVGRLLTFLGQVPARFRQFSIPPDLAKNIPVQALALCSDALATNVAVIKEIRAAVCAKQQAERDHKIYPFVSFFCAIHQLALSRKSIIYGFSNFWSSIARLAHLFEVSSFRVQFRSALVQEICSSYQFLAVSNLPENSRLWEQYRQEVVGPMSDSVPNKKRCELHRELATFDNGNIEDPNFVHFCVGSCCEGSSHEQKAHFALLQICRLYCLLFTYGFQVPLLYRWKHANNALKFCRETCLIIVYCFLLYKNYLI